MKEVRCPCCGREVTRGKYCIFCGNPLRGARETPAGSAAAARPEQEDGALWNPEKAYAQSRVKRVLLFVLIAVLAASAAVLFTARQRTASRRTSGTGAVPGQTEQLSASCGIQPGMTLAQMTACMEKNGFQALGDPYQNSGDSYQIFYETTVWGEKTEYSLAVLQSGETGGIQRALLHYLMEPEGKTYTFQNQGPVFRNLVNAFTRQYGTPAEWENPRSVLWWQAEGGTLFLRYITDSEVEIQYLLDETRKSETGQRGSSGGKATG